MYTWALFKDCKVTEIIFGSKSQLHYFQLITKKYGQLQTHPTKLSPSIQKKPRMAGPFKFINKAGQTLISTSTPLGSSIFIKASTVLEELE